MSDSIHNGGVCKTCNGGVNVWIAERHGVFIEGSVG